ncbi:MAG: SDR family oxidoreductase, partial [Pseudomonadota bacterium]
LARSMPVEQEPSTSSAMADEGFALAKDPDRAMEDALSRHPVGRFGTPEDVAKMAAFLISEKASYISGSVFTVDGGMTAASPLNPGLF